MDPLTQQRPVSPFSLRGIANAVSGAVQRVSAPRSAPAPAPAPVAAPAAPAQPAPTIGGAVSAIRQRHQALQDLADGGRVNMQNGGSIPGQSPHPAADNIPVNATAGEYMLPVDTVQAVGKENLDALVAATHTPLRGPKAAARGKRDMAAMMANGGEVEVTRDPISGSLSFSGGNVTGAPKYTGDAGFQPSGAGVSSIPSSLPAATPPPKSIGPAAAVASASAPAAPAAATATQAAPASTQYETDLARRNTETTASSIVDSPQRAAARAALKPPGAPDTPGQPAAPQIAPPAPSLPGPGMAAASQNAIRNLQAMQVTRPRANYADGGEVEERIPVPQADSKPMPAGPVRATITEPGGAVFGMYPSAISKRTSYATDARLRTGYTADGAAPDPMNVGVRSLPAGVAPSTAGAGRGTVNPPVVGATQTATAPAPAPAAAAPAAVEPVATTTAGAGPRRYVDAQGNVVEPVALGGAGVSVINDGSGPGSAARIATMERAGAIYRDIAAMRAAADNPNLPAGQGALIPATEVQERARDLLSPEYQAVRTAGMDARPAGPRAAAAAMEAERARQAAAQRDANETTRSTEREAAADRRQQVTEAGATQRNRETLASQERREGPSAAVRTESATLDLQAKKELQAAQGAYQRAVASGDPKKIKTAEDALRALTGKWDQPDKFAAVAVPGGVDPATGLPTGSSVVLYNTGTGEVKQGMSPQQVKAGTGGGAAPAAKSITKAEYDALPKGATYVKDGKQYIKG